jgi:hypothetical protein
MLLIASDSAKLAQEGYDMVWDTIMCRFIWNHYRDVTRFVEQLAKEKGFKLRLIVEITKDNVNFIDSMEYPEIKHLDGIRSKFGIFDRRAYMVAIFHEESSQSDQTFWSNSKILVDKQQTIFDKLWKMSIPLSTRKKELEYEENQHYQ